MATGGDLMAKSVYEQGQFYTRKNVLNHEAFRGWFQRALAAGAATPQAPLGEPFAGCNSMPFFMAELYPELSLSWRAWDVAPEALGGNLVPSIPIVKRDTLASFPQGCGAIITNPPYVNKAIATRRGWAISFEGCSDLYLLALKKSLAAAPYVAMVIPETFMVTSHSALESCTALVSLPGGAFEGTGVPVCLALFEPLGGGNPLLYRGDTLVGTKRAVEAKVAALVDRPPSPLSYKTRDEGGSLGVRCIDAAGDARMTYVKGNEVPRSSGKAFTRLSFFQGGESLSFTATEVALVVARANEILQEVRAVSHDLVFTSFKGSRRDRPYCRRLTYGWAGRIALAAVEDVVGARSPEASFL